MAGKRPCIDLTLSDDGDSQDSPSVLPGMPSSRSKHTEQPTHTTANGSSSIHRPAAKEHLLGHPKRRRLVRNAVLREEGQQGQSEDLADSETEGEGLQGQQGGGHTGKQAHVVSGSKQLDLRVSADGRQSSKPPQQEQHRLSKHTNRDTDKGRPPQLNLQKKGWGRGTPVGRSKKASAAESQSEGSEYDYKASEGGEEEGNSSEVLSSEEEGYSGRKKKSKAGKGGKGGSVRAPASKRAVADGAKKQQGRGRGSKSVGVKSEDGSEEGDGERKKQGKKRGAKQEAAGNKKSKTAKASTPTKAPLQLTLSGYLKPSSGKGQPTHALTNGHGKADAKPTSPTHTALPLCLSSSSTQHPQYHHQQQQQQQQHHSGTKLSQPPLPTSPTRHPLKLSRSSAAGSQDAGDPLSANKHSANKQSGLLEMMGSSKGQKKGSAAVGVARPPRKGQPCPTSVGGEKEGELWYDKHAPTTSAALAVHNKKVEEVRDFLERQQQQQQAFGQHTQGGSNMLITTGPVGCGKSTTVRLLAAEMGFQVVEYVPPAFTLWSELQHQGKSESRSLAPSYVSKLDDFESFVSRAKYPALPLLSKSTQQANEGSHKKLLLIDDLPHVHDLERSRRLAASLVDLASTARGPVVLICTQASGGGRDGGGNVATGGAKGLSKEVMSALEAAGAALLTFNPLTVNVVVKVLQQVAAAEDCPLSPDAAASIAGMADGDVRSAIQTLQAMFAGHHSQAPAQGKGRGKGSGGKAAKKVQKVGTAGGGLVGTEAERIASTQRDLGLDIFHALGKLLYNKREAPGGGELMPDGTAGTSSKSKRGMSKAAEAAEVAVAAVRKHSEQQEQIRRPEWMECFNFAQDELRESLRRPPSKYDPEGIVTQSGLEPIQVTAFLHENYHNFILEEAMEDVASAASYMSDAAYMASFRNNASSSDFSGGFWGLEESTTAINLTASCAGSVAARGLMFANAHPAPRKWLPLKAPAQNRVERACSENAESVQSTSARLAVWHGTLSAGGCSAAVSAQVMPWLRTLSYYQSHAALAQVMPSAWTTFNIDWQQNTRTGMNSRDQQQEQQEQLHQLQLSREQRGEVEGVGDGEGEGEEEDPIGDD